MDRSELSGAQAMLILRSMPSTNLQVGVEDLWCRGRRVLCTFVSSGRLWGLAGGLHLGERVGFPASTALAQDALEQLVCRFIGAALLASEFGFRGNQTALAGSL